MHKLCTLKAIELADLIRTGDVSSVEVVEAHIERVEAVNPHLNAVVHTRYSQARREAERADERRREGDTSPLLGVPCTVKESHGILGFPQTGGLVSRRRAYAERDSVLVKRLNAAGAIVIGITNVPEGLMWYESVNRVYGRTSNAYSTEHTCGGSSGGEGAIIGAGGSPFGLGGDVGGSIRLPASFNGIAGHKATGGRVPESGNWPGAEGLIARYKVTGPLARSVRDLRMLMPLLAKPDGEDLSVDGPPWVDTPPKDPEKIRVFWFDHNGIMPPSDGVNRAIRDAAACVGGVGCHVERWRPAGIERGLEIWATALDQAGGPSFSEVLADFREPIRLLQQWLRWPLRRSDHIMPSLALATLEKLLERFPNHSAKIAHTRLELRDEIERRLGVDGVLICPVFHRDAPRHGLQAVLNFPGFIYSGVFNPLELPSTTVRAGFSSRGLPIGVQVVGRRNNDALTLQVAEMIEDSIGGWDPNRLPSFKK